MARWREWHGQSKVSVKQHGLGAQVTGLPECKMQEMGLKNEVIVYQAVGTGEPLKGGVFRLTCQIAVRVTEGRFEGE